MSPVKGVNIVINTRQHQRKEIKWIEILLQTPIDDYRKNAIWRIIVRLVLIAG